jgi:hypothetical protein
MSSSYPGMVVYTCTPDTWETEARGSRVHDQPGLHNEVLSKKKKQKQNQKRRRNKNLQVFHGNLLLQGSIIFFVLLDLYRTK